MKSTTLSKIPVLTPKKNLVIHGLHCISVCPLKSHPNRYLARDKGHILKLYNEAKAKNAGLVLVNYGHSDNVKLIKVYEMNAKDGITKQKQIPMNVEEYNIWLKEVNQTFNVI